MADNNQSEVITVTDEEWAEYKESFKKVYNDPEEDKIRKDIYLETKIRITEHNKKFDAGEVSFSCGINQFADKKPDENACGCMVRGPKP